LAIGRDFDVIVVGGGIAGSALAGILARDGLGVLLLEREAAYRDRIRGEATWCWGVHEARRTGLTAVMERSGSVEIPRLAVLQNQAVISTHEFPREPMIGFSHPRLQEELFGWAAANGATALRPAKAIAVALNGRQEVTVAQEGRERVYRSRLVVGADGKTSAARRWAGGESVTDPEHHRFGGVLLEGLETDSTVLANATTPETGIFWFAAGANAHRLYLRLTIEQLRETGADRDFEAFLARAARYMPEGALAHVRQAGPLGFFPNSDTWASRIAGDGIVLIGDAAGAVDPTNGHGTSLLFRDVRELSELLRAERNWAVATAEFARRRAVYYAVVRANDLWYAHISSELGAEADRRRERHARAREHDPTLGGYALLEEDGPDGLVPDEAARRHYYGEDLA
jgi:2-polyprenyl-6-methoxyphenol hydroxylase-like FAD-dependent oxidoreductase